jgi:drug/metabolite transporter (DMT)-like permease
MLSSVTHYALIYSLLPCCTAILSAMVGKDRLGPVKLLGMVLSLLGCAVALSGGLPMTGDFIGSGDLLILLFTLMMSGHIVASSNVVRRFGAMVANTVMFGNSAVLLCLASLGWDEAQHEMPPASIIVGIIYIGLATAGVFVLRFRSLQFLSPATVGTYHNFIPIVTVLFAWLFLGESLGAHTMFGGVAVLAGAELVRRTHSSSLTWSVFRSKLLLRSAAGNTLSR